MQPLKNRLCSVTCRGDFKSKLKKGLKMPECAITGGPVIGAAQSPRKSQCNVEWSTYTGLHYAYNIGRAHANILAVLLFTSAQNLNVKSMSTTASLKYQSNWSFL